MTIKGERKFLTMCANPADPMPTGTAALIRLRDRVVASAAERGFYVSVRGFTGQGGAGIGQQQANGRTGGPENG